MISFQWLHVASLHALLEASKTHVTYYHVAAGDS